MNPTMPGHMASSSRRALRPAAIAGIISLGSVMAATAVLWVYYGTAVFYETLIAGLNACF